MSRGWARLVVVVAAATSSCRGSRAPSAYPPLLFVAPASGNFHRWRVPLYVVIHATECTEAQTIARFQRAGEEASSHYLVPRDETHPIIRFVDEFDTAYHAGNYQYNVQSVGIEHEGYLRDGGFPEGMYRRSARLTAAICRRWNIPIDREHLIGHSEVPDPDTPGLFGGRNHHVDPGPSWQWEHYLELVRQSARSPAK